MTCGCRFGGVRDAETQLLRVLADLRLPERWAAFVVTLTPRSIPPPTAMRLDDIERVTESLGLRFTPREYDDEDVWPASRSQKYPDRQLVMRITSPDPSSWPAHRLAFAVEIYPGTTPSSYSTNRVERLVARIRDELDRPDIGPVADETWYQTYDDAHRAIEWFIELCRDVAGVYAQSHGLSPGSTAAG
jgi:hypothetical protein